MSISVALSDNFTSDVATFTIQTESATPSPGYSRLLLVGRDQRATSAKTPSVLPDLAREEHVPGVHQAESSQHSR